MLVVGYWLSVVCGLWFVVRCLALGGCCLLVVVYWLLCVGRCACSVCCVLSVVRVRDSLADVCCALVVACCSLRVVCCVLLAMCCFMFAGYFLLFVGCASLFVVCCSLFLLCGPRFMCIWLLFVVGCFLRVVRRFACAVYRAWVLCIVCLCVRWLVLVVCCWPLAGSCSLFVVCRVPFVV